MENQDLEEIINFLEELIGDSSNPKNVRNKAQEVSTILKSDGELSMNASKALNVFEELSEDTNIEAFTRTQIWNIISMLEKVS